MFSPILLHPPLHLPNSDGHPATRGRITPDSTALTKQISEEIVERWKEYEEIALEKRLEYRRFWWQVTTIDDEAAEILSGYRGSIDLNGLKGLSDEAAASLGKHRGSLSFDGLKRLSDAAAEVFGSHREGYLCLRGLTHLSDVSAKSLGRHLNRRVLLNSGGNAEQAVHRYWENDDR